MSDEREEPVTWTERCDELEAMDAPDLTDRVEKLGAANTRLAVRISKLEDALERVCGERDEAIARSRDWKKKAKAFDKQAATWMRMLEEETKARHAYHAKACDIAGQRDLVKADLARVTAERDALIDKFYVGCAPCSMQDGTDLCVRHPPPKCEWPKKTDETPGENP